MKDVIYFIKRFWLMIIMFIIPVILYFIIKAYSDLY